MDVHPPRNGAIGYAPWPFPILEVVLLLQIKTEVRAFAGD